MAAMKPTKIALLVVTGLVLIGAGTCGTAYLPRSEKVNVTGTEVKRVDATTPGGGVNDVRYIQTQTVPDKQAKVFRNEDTRFGWPFYFKFDAVDLAGEAARISRNEPDAVVLITYYGYKDNVLGLQPNAVSLKVVDAAYEHVPVFNIALSVLFVAVVGFLFFKVWRWLSKREKASVDKAAATGAN